MRAAFALDDKYVVERGDIYLTGTQALVRLPLRQRRRDRAAGLNTAGFVSGYRGSPLGGYDKALWDAAAHLKADDIVFQPAVNEEMAATAIIGTQQVSLSPDATRDGVFAIWYGKGPGLDRAGDALKHANSLGTSPNGGVLVVAGDDHGAVSSSMAHQSEQAMMSWMMPVLNPASVRDYVEMGLLGFAMSRFSGCYVGFKAVSETVESAVTATTGFPRIRRPEDFAVPPGGLHIRWPDPQLAQEERLHRFKLPAAVAFARANGIDRVVIDSRRARIGIAAAGKAWLDLRQAVSDLGIGEAECAALGLRLYKIGLSWPLEPQGALGFARGLEKILVVEEKRPVIEGQLKDLLYHLPADRRPEIHGKTDPAGRPLLPTTGELSADSLAQVIADFLAAPEEIAERMRRRLSFLAEKTRGGAAETARRMPWFCPGCPHNTSTRLPEGHRALAGTGCHLMTVWMGRDTSSLIHMGGEGVNWVGQAPFCKSPHIFQNLGDGTYVHSGHTAIRQAVAAGVNITYKILFNDAVAMTGGQPAEGGLTVPVLTQQLHHAGVERIAVVGDDPGKYPLSAGFAPGVTLHDRGELDAVQRELASWPGVSVIVYEQVCAAEKRRRARRAKAEPPKRVVINPAVCENCGDCVAQSNCLAIKTIQTPLGPRRAIDQSACNTDFSCLLGLCPALVTVEGRLRRPAATAPPATALPEPTLPGLDQPYGILIGGVGGTGVVTIGQLLGVAAHAEGKAASVLDFTGLSQKGGGVLTHVRIASGENELHALRLGAGEADLMLAADLMVAAGAEAMATLRAGRSRIVGNDDLTPPATALQNAAAAPSAERLRRLLGKAVGEPAADFPAASSIVEALLGDTLYANVFLLGYAWQKGLIPLGRDALDHALILNRAAVDENRHAFAWGRLAAVDPAAVRKAAGLAPDAPEAEGLNEIVARRAAWLEDYQDSGLAGRYRALVARVGSAEGRLRKDRRQNLAAAVARGYFRVLACKDEYEVARLLTDPAFAASLSERFEDGWRANFHLVPPYAREERPRKRAYGRWMGLGLRLLARFKGLRGTAFDPFAHGAERVAERQWLADYESAIEAMLDRLDAASYDIAVELAGLPEEVRGFGAVKAASLVRARERRAKLLAGLGARDRRDLAAE